MNAGLLEPLYRIAFLLSGGWGGDRTYLLTSGLPSVFLQYDLTVFLNKTNALGPVKRIVLRPSPLFITRMNLLSPSRGFVQCCLSLTEVLFH